MVKTMNNKITIICSKKDLASQNIKNNLLQIREWNKVSDKVYEFKKFRIVEIDEFHIYQDYIDKKLEEKGLKSNLIIFASKHQSKDPRALLTVHFTGNIGDAKYGGRPRELAVAAPQALKSLLKSIYMLSRNEDFEVSMESTHHGPTALETPSVYIEIGSTEKEWVNETAGRIIANSILSLEENDAPIAVGFGGNHYAPRQTKIILDTDITFGHNFPNHQLKYLDEELIKQAFEKSKADFAYFDRKSMSKDQKKSLENIIKKLGYEVLRESDIRDIDGVPWDFCLQVREKTRELCPSGRTRITKGIKEELLKLCKDCACPKIKVAKIDPVLLREAENLDKKRLGDFLDKNNIAYLLRDNGTIAHVIIGIEEDCARIVAEELTKECLKILQEHYKVNYDPEESILYLEEEKFSPSKAKSLGVPEGPLFGKLAKKKSITINNKTITPDMVFEKIKKPIKIKHLYIPILCLKL